MTKAVSPVRDDFDVPADAGEYAEGLAKILRRIQPDDGQWIDCGRGWYPLIVKLDADLTDIAPGYRLFQVKEKFGGLRYYAESPRAEDEDGCEYVNQEIDGPFNELIHEAEVRSMTICELCGQPGSPQQVRGWIRTLCPACREEVN